MVSAPQIDRPAWPANRIFAAAALVLAGTMAISIPRVLARHERHKLLNGQLIDLQKSIGDTQRKIAETQREIVLVEAEIRARRQAP